MVSGGYGDSPRFRRVIFPPHVKNALFVEQRGRCRYCGRRMSNRFLEIDHKWPLSRNGGNEVANLQLLCTSCNLRKGIQTDEEFRERYWRLMPPDGSTPDPPIPQHRFSDETQFTRAAPEVRAIYRERFQDGRRRREPAGCIIGVLAVVAVIAAIAGLGSVAGRM